jgi:hypothetical protein
LQVCFLFAKWFDESSELIILKSVSPKYFSKDKTLKQNVLNFIEEMTLMANFNQWPVL